MADSTRYQLIRAIDSTIHHQERSVEIVNDVFIKYASHNKPEAEFIAMISDSIDKIRVLLLNFRDTM